MATHRDDDLKSTTPRSRRSAAHGPAPQEPFPGRAAARKAGGRGRRRGLKIVLWSTLGIVLVGGSGLAYAYVHLSGNIKTDDLYAGAPGQALHEKADAFGRTPINILVIGSDARSNTADCKLGGACTDASGARADVEMVLHVSADRSNATVMSIPRDLNTSWDGCNSPGHPSMGAQTEVKINSALAGGPGCSVNAVEQLTKIPIDHFMMVDFSGVVNMSDAVGGVRVCVNHNIYDPYSHLKLKEGWHVLEGDSALEFLRTRHGFGDGSDSQGRTVGQHIFLTALINKLKSAGTLSSPTRLWSLANAATESLTVDKGLKSPSSLVGLAEDINKVPTNRITFATMQTRDLKMPDGVWETLATGNAPQLFQAIADDQSLTGAGSSAKGASTKSSASASPVPVSSIAVQVDNGTSIVGRAKAVEQALTGQGFSQKGTANGNPAAKTSLTYPAGQKPQAEQVASALGLPSTALHQGSGPGIVLLIGSDWQKGTTFPGGTRSHAPVDAQAALTGAQEQNGSQKSTCAPVSTYTDVIGLDAGGRPTSSDDPVSSTSPERAYALSTNVEDSAP